MGRARGMTVAPVARGGTTMEFGFGLPTRGPMATPQNLATLARTGEELGFAIISVSDHIIIPKAIAPPTLTTKAVRLRAVQRASAWSNCRS